MSNANIQTTNGCRIYATDTIFVNGPITFNNISGNSNLQLVSATAVLMGFSAASLAGRLSDPRCDAMSVRSGTPLAGLNANADQVQSADSSRLIDADNSTNSKQSYTRLLVNAPVVQSRYLGLFQGVIIAEVLLMRVGSMSFTFDTVFSQVPVLPLIGIDKSVQVTIVP